MQYEKDHTHINFAVQLTFPISTVLEGGNPSSAKTLQFKRIWRCAVCNFYRPERSPPDDSAQVQRLAAVVSKADMTAPDAM
jgi:hypothetical protein